ncbi:60S ribosomal protein L30 [Mucor velutinosus]|uniref:60S ribosomal protein L30 n=1 Tax=Mucor velutinosus TaxID=708070 RepID=A0AAN7D846_9FUNG|nr:60S ribosomal protein L30 [Mucor velutinosus]
MEDINHSDRRNNSNMNSSRTSSSAIRDTRLTAKVTDHPWLTISTPYSDQSPSPSSSMEAKSTNYSTSMATMSSPSNMANMASNSKYDWRLHSLMLCRHIFTRGLVDGIGSDIQVFVPSWNKTYQLHRLVLDQNPYFKLLLQGGFREAESSQITLHFDKDNPFITMESFQFVLEYLYGKIDEPLITQSNVRQILATSSYFQLDVCGICVDFILKNLNHQNVVDYLLFTNELMVQGSDRICDAVFTFLCREAYHMDRSILASLPLEWLQKVIESDAFWVPSEYERYQFIQQIIRARYNIYSNSKSTSFVLTELDTNSNCYIISQSIYYMHMTFEQLESIQNDIHPLTKQKLVPERILKEALWQQIQLRSKIESASERDINLNMTVVSNMDKQRQNAKVANRLDDDDENRADVDQDDREQDQEEEPLRKYYPIPTDDTTTYTGESAITLASSASTTNYAKKRFSSPSPPIIAIEQYSIYPPFRFSVEFADVTSLKHGMRVYSDTVFYAGSNWNMYIQKTRSQRKGVLQLGVYLHRQSVSQNYNSSPASSTAEEQQPPQPQQHHETYTSTNPTSPTSPSPSGHLNQQAWSFSRYSDKRKVVKTWFKIYCPTRGPKHALTLFQSSPDNFSVLQSWGWRSTTLCADEDSSTVHVGTATSANSVNEQATASGSNNNNVNEADTATSSSATSSPPPLTYTPHTSNQLQYLQSTYDLRTLKTALNSCNAKKNTSGKSTMSTSNSGPTLRFTVVMGHV